MFQSYKAIGVKDHSDLSSLQLILLRPKFRPKVWLHASATWSCKGGVYAYATRSNYRLFKFVQNKLKQILQIGKLLNNVEGHTDSQTVRQIHGIAMARHYHVLS